MSIIDKQYIDYSKTMITEFYKNLSTTSFKDINNKKILELYKISENIQENKNSYNLINYIKTIKKINNSEKINKDSEKFILFMFSIDPNFEAAKIYGESNHISEIRIKMIKHFGVFDRRLILIENFFIKYFLTEEKRNKIVEEIEKRIFK